MSTAKKQDKDKITVKDRVKALCKARGISVAQMQEETGIGNIVSRWDRYNPRMENLAAVAVYFNVPIESLTGDPLPEEKENPATVNSNEELEDAIRRGKNAYFNSLFDRASPEVQDEVISLLLEKLRNQ